MRAAGAPGTAAASYRVDEPEAVFADALASWEARPADPDGCVEKVAQALIPFMPPMAPVPRKAMAEEAAVAALQAMKS